MKIVQIVTQMESGGAQRVAYLLHQALRARGHQCELWFLYVKRPTYQDEPGIRSLCAHKPAAVDYVRIIMRLKDWMEEFQPEAIITHTHYANVLGLTIGMLRKVKRRIAVQHNPVQTYPGLSQQGDWLCGTIGVYTNQVAVSDAVLQSMASYPARYQKKVYRIYNGTTFGKEAESSQPNIVSRLPRSGPRILHVGRFSNQKNHKFLIDVLARIPDAKLVLIGDGELRNEIAQLVRTMKLEDRVTFLGEISPSEVCAVMGACDLFLFPSLYEAMPMALLEAMASGMAVVASDIPANRELLQDTGILSALDAEAFTKAASRLLADRPYALEFGGKAAARAAQFTVNSMADNYEQLLLAS